MKILHVGISVRDLDEAIEWYKNILGFKLLWKKSYDDLQSSIAFVKKDDFEIELFQHFHSIDLPKERRMPKNDIQTQGTKHIAFEVKNIQSLFEDFKNKNVDIVFGPVESPPKDALFGFIRDPSGVLIEIIEKNQS